MAKKSTKSETLTLRLDPKTRFMLEFVARLKGQTITTVFERAIQDAADQTRIDKYNGLVYTWKNYWNVEQGVRDILIFGEPTLRPTFEEEKRLEFTRKYWPFFYTTSEKMIIQNDYIGILWGRIKEFTELDEASRTTNYWAAGDAMEAALKTAHVTPPKWRELLHVPNNSSN